MSGPGAGWPDDDDDVLLASIGDAVRHARAVPERFTAVGRAAFAWHDIDVDLAALQFDSAVSGIPVGARADGAGMRALSFEGHGIAIEVELSAQGLMGQVVPAQPGTVELWVDGAEPHSVVLDDNGWFDLGPRPERTFRLCVRTGPAVVLTDRVRPEADNPGQS